jgi:Ca-activated chloride channel homolog
MMPSPAMVLSDVRFAWPWLLAVAALVPWLLILLHRWSEKRARRKLDGVIAPRLREQLLRSVDYGRRWRKVIILAVGMIALFLAVARPQFGLKPMEVERSSVDFIIALDLSRSMLAEDMEAKSRLHAAKAGINQLLDEIGSDRAGLIAFAGDAFLAAPVTQDHESVKRNLAALDTNSITKQGTDMAKAIKLAVKTFEGGKYETKALVFVTDGEELQGDAMVAAREASRKGMMIFTVGVGSAFGARIPAVREGRGESGNLGRFAKNEFGNDVLTRLNERMLQQLAASGRGFYEHLGPEGEGLVSVWHKGLEPLAKGTQTKQSKDREDYFQWPLALAIALILLEMLVSDRRNHVNPVRA